MNAPKPVLLHDDEHSVPNHPKLTYTHEQGTRRIVDRASGIDIRIILQWLRDDELPADITRESLEACVAYQSEIDAEEFRLAYLTCSTRAEIFGGKHLARFRMLPLADREILRRVFTEAPYEEPPVRTGPDDHPHPCDCEALVLSIPHRGLCGMSKCTRCLSVWDARLDGRQKGTWHPAPTYVDNLDAIRFTSSVASPQPLPETKES